ncbi:cell envelope integrity EipB family protein [Ciceribacter sp. L1K23]|uniref:cell envelope integrity EipB family protein n=1 Tax=unclassified Ciceribacter TaxID=2628820 RepID=UPI001ABE6977|nr:MULTISPECIES: cell envelope integrity EipB family protein [unclassified Ciceribacter]MBO3760164.1 cell envelope integrity EipB family protein [Ciceribacter sp. L1K22]MBR0555717.1 cell envelope integrity EipB family protein [Ciceribacter sp. L1K23]
MQSSRTAIVATVVATAGCLSAASASATIAAGLVPHRAVYDIELKEASERSGIEGLSGRLVFEFSGSECAGYTTNYRFVNRIDTGDQVRVTDQQSVMFEDLKAGTFEFESKSFTDDQLDKDVSGLAQEEKEGVKIELSEPARRTVELASSHFPAEHMLEIIDRARQGRAIFEARIFDGSEDGDRSYMTTIVVGNSQPSTAEDPEVKAAGDLAKSSYWPVSIAYFDEAGAGDQLPIYTNSFKLYENGITRDLTLDYGDFVLTGKLSRLEILGDGDCK